MSRHARVLGATAVAVVVVLTSAQPVAAQGADPGVPPPPGAAPAPTGAVPAPPAAVTPGAPAPTATVAEEKFNPATELALQGGATQLHLYGIGSTLVDVWGALGMHASEMLAFHVGLGYQRGATPNGLRMERMRLGFDFEMVVDRFRPGIGIDLWRLGFRRANELETIWTWGPSAFVTVAFDAVYLGDHALFIKARLDGSVALFEKATTWSPSLGIGVRFVFPGEKK